MYEVIHRPGMYGWDYTCTTAPMLQGGSRTYEGSVDAAEHAVRRHMGRLLGERVTLDQARECILHERVAPMRFAATV